MAYVHCYWYTDTHVGHDIQEMDSVFVERQNVFGSFGRVGHASHGKETGPKQRPLLEYLCKEPPQVSSEL